MSVTAVPLRPVKASYKVWIWLGVLVAVALAGALAWGGTRAPAVAHYSDAEFLAWNKNQPGVQTTASGLQYKVIEPGEGPTATDGDGAALEIHGTLRDGKEFQPKAPMRVQIGQPLIPGFTEGVKLMKKGAKYRFWLPPALGYGAEPSADNELAGKVLVFDVTMQELIPAAILQQMMMQGGAGRPGAGAGAEGGAPQGEHAE